ncbi:hypothetical protein CQW23_16831 [Capsicum baccatum]|uniref:Transmembrane protein n=1 Tax=Capsicum baccatum TaxID=33114 RepID=A0A2G2WC17_CAPBA|nr:hypothetical protein CQW23_16831 [Capsicum baccatum]
MYFLKKLLNLKGDDGFQMNEVLVGLWYIMGLWPLVYSMLLLPTARSSKGSIPVWPFLVLSCFGGAYALIPYFALWKPPPPPVEETELQRWPLNLLESKLTAGVYQVEMSGRNFINTSEKADSFFIGIKAKIIENEEGYHCRQLTLIHVMSIDFSLLSAFAPFWIYNDMTARKCCSVEHSSAVEMKAIYAVKMTIFNGEKSSFSS